MNSIVALLAIAMAVPAFAATAKRIDPPPKHDLHPLTVTLDVKDEEVHKILKSMQAQCGIRNLAIDPDVQGKGTFFLSDLPCTTAFDVVLRTLHLKAVTYSNSLAAVEPRR